jgi:peptide/nickel transport system permease protein
MGSRVGQRAPVWRYLLRRLLLAVPVVLGIAVITFFMLRLIPGDPVTTLLGIHATPAAIASLRHQLGLDQPIYRQFWNFLAGLARGNVGRSIYYQTSVRSLIASHIAVSAALVALSAVFSVAITVPLAGLAAARKDRAADHGVRVFSLLGLGMPSFVFGIALILLFAVKLHWFDAGGWGTSPLEHLRGLILPALTASVAIVPVLIRSLRVGMLEVIEADFVATARSKGLSPARVLFAHVARNAMIPTITLLGVNMAYLIGGTVVIENVFALNGLGALMLTSIDNRDFPVVQGIAIVYALAVVAVNLLTDLVAFRLDPRIRLR